MLTASAPGLDGDHVTAIVHEMMFLLGPTGVPVEVELMDDETTHRLRAVVPAASGPKAQRNMAALVATLQSSGCAASFSVTPRMERVSGNVYGLLADRLSPRGASATPSSKLEEEIRARLATAGFEQESVSTPIAHIAADRLSERRIEPDAAAAEPTHDVPAIVLGAGAPPWALRVRTSNEFGVRTLALDFTKDGRTTTVEIVNAESLSRSAMASELQSRLDEAGLDARVHAQSTQILVDMRR